jgi:hypothetical protein
MTDFLKRISQTALGRAPAVQPLVVSRYAPSPHLAVPEMLQSKGGLESSAEPKPKSDAESHSQSYRFSASVTADPTGRRAPAQPIAGTTQRESGEFLLPQPATAEAARSYPPRPAAVSETVQGPLEASVSHHPAVLNVQDLTGRETNHVTGPAEQTPTRGTPSGDKQLKQSPPPTVHSESPARPDVGGGVAEVIAVREDPRHQRDTFDPPVATGQGEDAFVVDESIPRANERVSHVIPVLNSEQFDRGHSASESFPQSLYSELEIREGPTNSRAETLKSESPLPEQSISRRADSGLRSSQDRGAANTSSAPVVRVTIERIEVRAVMPPSQPVEVSAPPPKLSLDEYLRRHNGRER